MPMISGGSLLLIAAASVAVVTTLASGAALWAMTRRRRRQHLPEFTPPVTIYKPLKGLDEGLEENLRSFFQLDYPEYQLLFCVADPDDPAIEVVRRLLAEFPDHDAELIIGCSAFGLNPKVESLAMMDRFRRHDVILISDSNVRVRPEYLRETTCYLAEEGVGLVTNLFAGVGERTFGAALENLQLNGFVAGNVAWGNSLGLTCVVGKSMLMPAHVLEAIGGFASVRNLLAEDQAIGLKVRRAGYSIRLSHHVIENVNSHRGLRWFLNRHSRWFKIRRQMAGPLFVIEPLANHATIALAWAFSDDSGIAWGGLLGLIGLGIARDAAQCRLLRGEAPGWKTLALSPIKDLFLMPIWFDALINPRVIWRGHRLIVGRFTRLRVARVPREVHQRVRKIRRLRSRVGRGSLPSGS
ncbi:ceramide glucosyltransferase [Tautonia sociabilis]|uniref:Ceramide glucosyltransferase n=1 Tax=Tautonia sociabilis TaxID=2080755 RepID=A0A432MQ57_9BACT|nr:ceramide glucosyltransferase [Tautonia sociabilis]RUL89195.1 ceramide glucosyltransferase [Tautonia sociabilis]